MGTNFLELRGGLDIPNTNYVSFTPLPSKRKNVYEKGNTMFDGANSVCSGMLQLESIL